MDSFGERLSAAVGERGPLCVGIDPHDALLVEWGLPLTPAGLRAFCETVVEAVSDRVAVVKPQSAFFERYGSAGIAVLESTIRQSRRNGALVLLDVKRGDIGSTAQAYAQAYLDPTSALSADAITVSPYPGLGSLEPFYAAAARHGAGVFVLALTSNPGESTGLQQARDPDGRSVAQTVVDAVGARNGPGLHGSYGVVIGATTGPTTLDLTRLGGPVLVPGLGAQGASAADLPAVLDGLTGVALPSYSRAVLRHGPSIEGLRKAVEMCLAECRNVRNNPVL